MPKGLIVLLAVILLVIAGSVIWLNHLLAKPLHLESMESLVIVPGERLGGVADQLIEQGWLPWTRFQFTMYGRFTADAGHIKAGEYHLEPGLTVPDFLMRLRKGMVVQRTITFPEGWTALQWFRHLANTDTLVQNQFDTLVENAGSPESLEGQLFPDTYAYTLGDSAVTIIARAQEKMTEILTDVWHQRSHEIAIRSKQEAVILASMIEKETGFEGDRKLIASVFTNRLKIGMKLQSDPTVIYGLEGFDGDLKRSHLRVSHPHNTYVIDALPVGPICNPGVLSLQAALNPEVSPYLYFVAKGDGRSQFSETLEQHNAAVVRYQKSGRVENYRSAPPIEAVDGLKP